MSIIKNNNKGDRVARLQAVFVEERKYIPILDMLAYYEKEHSQKDILYKALHLLAHRWAKNNDYNINIQPDNHIAQILAYLKELHKGQDEMMEAILKMRSGVISMDEFDSKVSDIQERRNSDVISALEGASNYSGGFFMLEDDDGDTDE